MLNAAQSFFSQETQWHLLGYDNRSPLQKINKLKLDFISEAKLGYDCQVLLITRLIQFSEAIQIDKSL